MSNGLSIYTTTVPYEESISVDTLDDLEKARKAAFRSKKQLHDLDKLNRYSNYWTRTDRLAFLLRYLGEETCNSEVRNFLKKLQSSAKK